MPNIVIRGLTAYTEHDILKNACIEVTDGLIKSLHATTNSTHKILDFPASYHLIPGMIDLHVHGANGKDVMDSKVDSLNVISKALLCEGVTGFLPTTMTASIEHIEKALCSVRDFMQQEAEGAKALGVHLEGPFISPVKIGAQKHDYLLPLKSSYIEHWQKLSDHIIKIVTFAPELPGSHEFISYLINQKIIASIGHTDASYDECMTAIDSGCSHMTHLFNAMRGMHQRDPGTVGAALLSDSVTAEIIADGIHVHPKMLALALRMKGSEKVILVTDAMRAKCLGDGEYELGGQWVEVKNRIARLSDGTLAGSTLSMLDALKNFMQFTGFNLSSAIKLVAENPAKILGIFNKTGSIAAGKAADLVILNEKLEVVAVLVQGKLHAYIKIG